jgi:hypothetical protein
VDVNAASISYNSNSPIVRNRGGVYTFTLTLSSSASGRNVPAARDGNWYVTYLLDNIAHDTDGYMQSGITLPPGQLSHADYVRGFGAGGSISLTVANVNINFNFATCEKPLFLCMLVMPDSTAAFNDPNTSNNVACISLDRYKDCYPGMSVSALIQCGVWYMSTGLVYL